VQQRKRKSRRAERLLGEPEQHDRVLAAGEQEHGPLAFGGELAQDMDCLVLEGAQVRPAIRPDGGHFAGDPRARSMSSIAFCLASLVRASSTIASRLVMSNRRGG